MDQFLASNRAGYRAAGLRLALVAMTTAVLAMMCLGTLSNSKPGTLTWGRLTDFWAMAIAISDIKLGMDGGIGRREISLRLAKDLTVTGDDVVAHDGKTKLDVTPELIDKALQAAISIKPSDLEDVTLDSGKIVTTLHEDIGYSDFYNLAFRIFGFSAFSTLYLFFAILILECLIFVAAYRRSLVALSTLTLLVTAIFLTTTTIFDLLVPSPAANRFLSTLTLIPLLHIALTALGTERIGKASRTLLAAQMLLFGATITLRTSSAWTLFAILGMVGMVVLVRRKRLWNALSSNSQTNWLAKVVSDAKLYRVVVISSLALGSAFGYGAIRSSQLHLIYQGDDVMPHHMRWHSAAIGLSQSPDWLEQNIWNFGPEIVYDSIGNQIFYKYMVRNMPKTPWRWAGFSKVRLADRIIKDEFFRFVSMRPWYVVKLYLFYKPANIVATVGPKLAAIPAVGWAIGLLAVALASVALSSARWTIAKRDVYGFACIFFLASLMPLMWAYAVPHAIGDQLIATLFLAGLGSAGVVSALVGGRFFRPVESAEGGLRLDRDRPAA